MGVLISEPEYLFHGVHISLCHDPMNYIKDDSFVGRDAKPHNKYIFLHLIYRITTFQTVIPVAETHSIIVEQLYSHLLTDAVLPMEKRKHAIHQQLYGQTTTTSHFAYDGPLNISKSLTSVLVYNRGCKSLVSKVSPMAIALVSFNSIADTATATIARNYFASDSTTSCAFKIYRKEFLHVSLS